MTKPSAAEPRFWRRYIGWADLGATFSEEECRQLLAQDPTTLVPAMHLYALSQGREYADEAAKLLEQCKAEGTISARYLASVIEGVLKRRGSGRRS